MTESNRRLEKVNGQWAYVSDVEYTPKKTKSRLDKDRSLTEILGVFK